MGIYWRAAPNSLSSRVKDEPSKSLTEISVNGNVFSFGIPSAKEMVLFGAEYAILARTDKRSSLSIISIDIIRKSLILIEAEC